MRYLLNLPLGIAFLTTMRSLIVALGGSPGGGDATLGAAYEMLFEITITWLMLGVVLTACGTMGGFRWPQVRGAAGFFTGLMAFVVILLVSLEAIGVAMELSSSQHWGAGQVVSARLVAFGLPLLIIFYGGWIVNTAPPSRDRAAVHAGALGGAGLLCVLALVVAMREMAREAQHAQERVVVENKEQEEKDNAIRQQLAQLTDANSLFDWIAFVGDNVPDDVKMEARRRVVARPNFEAELGQALDNVGNYPWSEYAMVLTRILPFRPSPALGEPVRHAIMGFAARLTTGATVVTYDGDKYLDKYYTYQLDDVLKLAERMAETAGVDEGDAIDAIVKAVALYPKSDAARNYPARAAASRKKIAQIIAARPK